MYRLTIENFGEVMKIETSQGKVKYEKDRAYIYALVIEKGGYARLDDAIQKFRASMQEDLQTFLHTKN